MRFSWCMCGVGLVTLALAAHPQPVTDAQETPNHTKAADKKPDSKVDKFDEEILRRAKLSTEPDVLLDFLKKRTLPEKDRPDIERLVRQLGSADYRLREKAMTELIARGSATFDVLRTAPNAASDCEATRRIERAMQTIREKGAGAEVPAAAVRVVAARQSAALVETLLAYLPFAENDAVVDEIRYALLKHALKDGKANPSLIAALADRASLRRATAAEVLARVAHADNKATLQKLLADPDANVRYRLARALVLKGQRDALPVLIDTLADLPVNAAWQAEDFLLKLTTSDTAPTAPMSNDKDARAKCTAGWQAWWKKHGEKADLSKAEDTPRMLGRTLIVLLDQNSVIDLGPDNQPRFEVRNLTFPLDAQLLNDDHVLVAEYQANRVTERNSRGEVVWQKAINTGISGGPQVAQRLPNGNTFIATANQFLEYDKDDNTVLSVRLAPDGQQKNMKSMKLANGEIVSMQSDARIVRYDAKGNELSSFQVAMGMRLFGGRLHMLPNGRVLVPHHGEGKVAEYDSRGKVVWEVNFDQPIVASRLPNGNTLITSMNPWVGAVEVDRLGNHVWSYQHASNTRVTRAIRR